MKVAMMQPAFMPWQGFFGLIRQVDCFILLDDFQFSVQSYHQRNRLFVNPGQVDWYSVPVVKAVSYQAPLNKAKIDEKSPWRKKMWKRIEQNYRKAPFFTELGGPLEEWLLKPWDNLAEQNMAFIHWVCGLLGYALEFRTSSGYPGAGERSLRVVELLKWAGGDSYYSARGSFEYMREDGVFPLASIPTFFQRFIPRPYDQIGSPGQFVPYLSILDALMNIGPSGTGDLIERGMDEWSSWDVMLAEPARELPDGTEPAEG